MKGDVTGKVIEWEKGELMIQMTDTFGIGYPIDFIDITSVTFDEPYKKGLGLYSIRSVTSYKYSNRRLFWMERQKE